MSNRSGKIDLHIHSTVSDGTDEPQLLLKIVKEAGITAFSVTDHDAVKSGQIIKKMLKKDDPLFIPGVEFSSKDELGRYHILGYGFDPDAKPLHDLVSYSHKLRMEKTRSRMEKLKTDFDVSFPEHEIKRLFSLDNPGKPHIGNLIVKYGYAKTKEEAFGKYIDKIRLHSESVLPQKVISSILAGGGVPVLAHPLFGNGSDRLTVEEMEQRLRRLIDCGLQGVEAFYSGFSPEQSSDMLSLAEKYDLYVTAGSDYHGTNKKIPIGKTGLDEALDYPEGMERFLSLF